MSANNYLLVDTRRSLRDIIEGYDFDPKNRIVIYLKSSSDRAYLLTINGNKKIDALKVYDNENASDAKFLAKAVSDPRVAYPATSYGLVP